MLLREIIHRSMFESLTEETDEKREKLRVVKNLTFVMSP